MQISKVDIMVYTTPIDKQYFERLKGIPLPTKKENNEYLLLHMYGNGVLAPGNFNFKVYRNTKGELKLVATDKQTLEHLLRGASLGTLSDALDED